MSDTPRMERDSVLKCLDCNASPFIVFRRQIRQANGRLSDFYESVLWPNGASILPPIDPTKIVCPDCGDELKRVAG